MGKLRLGETARISNAKRESRYVVHADFGNSKLIYLHPVENVKWMLIPIPCHFMSQIDGSLLQIDNNFHDYSMSFIQILFVFHAQT